MFKKELANVERCRKDAMGEFELETSLTVYEVAVDVMHDKDGNVMKNRDGSDRYRYYNDEEFVELEADMDVKVIRDGFYKKLHKIEEDFVEKVDRDGKKIYFVVDPEKVSKLAKGTKLIPSKNECYKIPSEVGYVLVDETIEGTQKILAVRKFQTEDHKAEAEEVLKTSRYAHHD